MRRLLPAVLLLAAPLLHAQSSCPTTPPGYMFVVSACGSYCTAGTPALFHLQAPIPDCPAPPPGQPPSCPPLGYQLQGCDLVTWKFNDGSAPAAGGAFISHTFAVPGAYQVTATISNSLGITEAGPASVIVAASTPTFVNFSQSLYDVLETAGSITFTLNRSGNLSVTSTVHYAHAENAPGPVANQVEVATGDVIFGPGETTKTFSLKVYDDHLFTGNVYDNVFVSASDGTLFGQPGSAASSTYAPFHLIETDAPPTASVSDVRVSEAAGGADVVVKLTAPVGVTLNIYGVLADGTATYPADYSAIGAVGTIEMGKTEGVLHVPIVNDDVPEPDETLTMRAVITWPPVGIAFTRDTAVITIVNDDAGITPPTMQIATGAKVTMKLDVGQATATTLTIPLQSSSPDVVEVPASVTLAAGQSSASFTAHALKAGRTRVTATVPDKTASAAIVTVVDSVAVVTDPGSLSLHTGTEGVVNVSIQPPRTSAQVLTVWSTNPSVAAAPDSLTVPAGGTAALRIKAVASGVATIWLVNVDGAAFPVDVTVADVPARRHATR